jgi:CheY-like chemotaxis protein
MVADDSQGICNLVQLILEPLGYRVVIATSNIANRVREEKPGLLLLDVGMEGETDGLEVARQLGVDPETREIPILLLSAIGNLHALAKEVGAAGFIEKPFRMHALREVVQRFLRPTPS